MVDVLASLDIRSMATVRLRTWRGHYENAVKQPHKGEGEAQMPLHA